MTFSSIIYKRRVTVVNFYKRCIVSLVSYRVSESFLVDLFLYSL